MLKYNWSSEEKKNERVLGMVAAKTWGDSHFFLSASLYKN